LAKNISDLLADFDDHMINKKSAHLDMFFDEKWNIKAETISFGHDIEASWLLQEVAEILKDEHWITKMKSNALKMTDAAAEGLDKDGGLWYEIEPAKHGLVKEKHWWPQAEALVGFLNAWQISGDEKYLRYVFNNWAFIKKHILDQQHGEWFWGIRNDYSVMPGEDKVGLWKCPYHNVRACLETIRRLREYS
jgi:mannobiose 2-epimerase